MLIPIALVVFLLVVTAFIAHWSDNLGKKLGKKRVSVLGLRPRTSATVLTVASSWGIMLVTLTALLVTVAPLRRALFRYEETNKKLASSEKNLGISQERLRNAQFKLQNTQFKLRSAEGAAADAVKDARFKIATFQRATKKAASDAQKAINVAQARQKEAAATLTIARRKLSVLQGQLSTTQAQLAQGKAQVTKAEKELQQAEQNLVAKQNQIKSVEQKRQKIYEAAIRVGRATIALGKQTVALSKQIAALKADAANINRENARVKTENVRIKAESERFGQKAAERIDDLSVVVLNDIRLPVDQTLAERRIDAGQSSYQVGRELQTLLEASRTATNGFIDGAKLVVGSVVPDAKNQKMIQLNEVQTMQLYARLLTSSGQSVSARVAPIANYPAGSAEVLGRFVFVPIRTIYIARENIAVGTIDTSKSESSIFGQLQKLVDDARYNAVKNGASPPLSPDSKNFFDGDTGQKLLDTLREVEKISHPVQVRIVAARDLDSAEPLQIRFVVEN